MRHYAKLILVACCSGTFVVPCCRSFAQQKQAEAKRRVVSKVVPAYPDLARRIHINGTVRVEVVVAPDGSPKTPKVLGGHPLLVQSATDAISKWRWIPSPQETTESIEIRFGPN